MKINRFLLATTVLGGAVLVSIPSLSTGFSLLGTSIGMALRR